MLFDKNGFYFMDNGNNGYDFAVDIMNGNIPSNNLIVDDNGNKTLKLYDKDEAFEKGNAFPNLYDPYKNYKPRDVKVDNQRERALLDIQKLDFMVIDLNLYLDLHPNDTYAYKLFRDYVNECKRKKDAYTRVYGPIMLDDLTDEYEWSSGVWPWEKGVM